MVLNVSRDRLPEKLTSDESVLCISMQSDGTTSSVNRTNVSLDLSDSDTLFLTGFLRVVLPISYQFNPDLVYVYAGREVASGKTKVGLAM